MENRLIGGIIIGFILGIFVMLFTDDSDDLLVTDWVSSQGFSVTCLRGTTNCYCNYYKDNNSKRASIGKCPFEDIGIKLPLQ